MTIKVGDKIPQVNLFTMGAKGPEQLGTDAIFGGKKVVLFAVPGAFTPTCSNAHVPGFVVNADALKAKGVDTIACLSVNDAFVMGAWGENQNADQLLMLADGNGEFTQAVGLTLDGSGFGLGERSLRYAMIVEDGTVKVLNVEASAGELETSSAEAMLAAL